jgi:hypothetical protein
VIGRGKTWVFLQLGWPLRKSLLTFGVRGNTSSGLGVRRQTVASIAVDQKSMGHTEGQRSWKNVFFCVISVSLMDKCFDAWG